MAWLLCLYLLHTVGGACECKGGEGPASNCSSSRHGGRPWCYVADPKACPDTRRHGSGSGRRRGSAGDHDGMGGHHGRHERDSQGSRHGGNGDGRRRRQRRLNSTVNGSEVTMPAAEATTTTGLETTLPSAEPFYTYHYYTWSSVPCGDGAFAEDLREGDRGDKPGRGGKPGRTILAVIAAVAACACGVLCCGGAVFAWRRRKGARTATLAASGGNGATEPGYKAPSLPVVLGQAVASSETEMGKTPV